MENSQKCCIIVYGCAKNQVDAEEMAGRLRQAGYEVTPDASDADVIIVHTCGFIEEAKKESVQGILEACRIANDSGDSNYAKNSGGSVAKNGSDGRVGNNHGDSRTAKSPKVVVTGCLSQRYPNDILNEIPEVAGIAGTAAPRDIVSIVEYALRPVPLRADDSAAAMPTGRTLAVRTEMNTAAAVPTGRSLIARAEMNADETGGTVADEADQGGSPPNACASSISPSGVSAGGTSTARFNFVSDPGRGAPGGASRALLTPGQTWAYLRLSEGCRHHCTYCAIPSMRGGLASRPVSDILAEARSLVQAGVLELDLIAEDLCDYGYEWDGKRHLAGLVRELAKIRELAWVRLLYLRPDGVTEELAEAMASERVAPYVDLPIEHGSGQVLRRMGRPGPDEIMKAVERLRAALPRVFIRTTVITGFPGETEHDIEETKSLLSAMGAHRVGVFPYSREEGTPAYNLPGQVPVEVARERGEAIRRFGLDLARVSSKSMLGNEIPVVLVKPSVRPGYWVGRGPHQAPEVDGRVYVKLDKLYGPVHPFVDVRIHRSGVLDLFGTAEDKRQLS